VSEGVVWVMDIGVMEYWKNGMLEGRRNLPLPRGKAFHPAKLAAALFYRGFVRF
jgi:hypothetical protein